MNRVKNIQIAKDTIKTTKAGYYISETEKIFLSHPFEGTDFSAATVLTTEKLISIADDEDDFFQNSFYGSTGASFYLVDSDSFEAASSFENCIVMNFANAIHPGGGFLNGASAQEESLCRCSTLYASLSSEKAKAMYQHNKEFINPCYSDYMILSENVTVFKDIDGNYLKKPFYTAVMTIPAPNINSEAKNVSENELNDVILTRLRYFLYACARYGYRNLVLGAWGCGAFGNDPFMVSDCFYKLFFKEGFNEFFDNIVFAILGKGVNFTAFKTVFGEKIEDCTFRADSKTNFYIQSKYSFPHLTYSINDISDVNVGSAYGITESGIPFIADLWFEDGNKNISIYIPEDALSFNGKKPSNPASAIIPFSFKVQATTASVFRTGTILRDVYYDNENEIFIDFLKENKLVFFESEYIYCGIEHLTDATGKDIICAHILLEKSESPVARTTLNFAPFKPTFKNEKKRKFKLLK